MSGSQLLGPVQTNQCRPMGEQSGDLREQDEFEVVIGHLRLE